MDRTMNPSPPKQPMTPEEVGLLVKIYRDAMEWSQEQLADLSGLAVRTIQRVEAGHASSRDTRRAIARGFQIPDLDVFLKPNPFPTPEELEQQKADFDRRYLVLDVSPTDGRALMAILDASTKQGIAAISPWSTVELPDATADVFAAAVNHVRDCMDMADVATRREMLDCGDKVDAMTAELRATGFCLRVAVRRTDITNRAWPDPTPMRLTVIYLLAAPLGAPPAKVSVPQELGSIGMPGEWSLGPEQMLTG